ncbi:MAG: RNA methyltransferase [Hyphomicrobiales bacterium]|nr:RNA methyltransferase [Hyphomicrobiales bacterium]MCP5370185.1 RNA methyltransferase [Hyphomicrobiales bacterium]
MRGFFAVGAMGISKAMNAGAIFRTAHAFGASFVFTVGAAYTREEGGLADTSDTPANVPFYEFPDLDSLLLPDGCSLVAVELADDAVELPSFRHPRRAAYLLGPERGSLAPEVLDRCDHVVKIPTRFCVNVSVAAALVMYDRVQSMGRFAPRPVGPGGPIAAPPEHVSGGPKYRRAVAGFRAAPPGYDGA